MKRSYLAGIGIITLLIVTPAFAQMDMTRQPGQTDVQGQQQAQDQGMGQGMGMMGAGDDEDGAVHDEGPLYDDGPAS
ncbi:MAG: hypothetical protein ACP5J5_01375 [Dissulfurimicrobium sp.]|uniref:hypothetical protein n=1 Tax=Dissulfurimicrobium hydrothermale TaxID=1750598 RepID=UPI003C71DBA4